MPEEGTQTQLAREKIKQILPEKGFKIGEEESFPCLNNAGEAIWPPYRADMVVRLTFILEFDPMKLHGTKRHRNHDQWRDTNILREYDIKTVRLDPRDILKQTPNEILEEIEYQLCRSLEK